MIYLHPAGTGGEANTKESASRTFSHVILFSWDGVQYNHLMELYDSGNLPNLRQMVNTFSLPPLRALITDHYTETNYGHPSLLSGMGQGSVQGCPDSITIWENIEAWNSSWVTGSIAGKSKFTSAIFPNAKDDVDFWFAADTSAGAVTDLALDFVRNFSDQSFFLFVHYREPDYAGHGYGENSQQYFDALIECDAQLGRILSLLESEDIRDSTAILVSTDHGFTEDGTTHSGPAWGAADSDPDLYTVWIICDRDSVNISEAGNEFWDQNDVAPTVYSLIGLEDYASRWSYIRGSALWDRCFDVRDVAVTEIQLSTAVVTPNETVRIGVSLENQGSYTEIPEVSVYRNGTLISAKTLAFPDTPLFPHGADASRRSFTIEWDVADIPAGTYSISAQASVVPAGGGSHPSLAYTKNETQLSDNSLVGGLVEVVKHDVVLASVAADREWVYEGHEVSVDVTVANEGSVIETVEVKLYYNFTADGKIGTKYLVLSPHQVLTTCFHWNTANVPHQNYTLVAVASVSAPDIQPLDNTLAGGHVRVRISGDVNDDNVVNMSDLWLLAAAFGFGEGSLGWVSDFDMNQDKVTDMLDLYMAVLSFGHV